MCVVFVSADSNYNITISTKAALNYSGEVTWEPPAIFKSMCHMNVQWSAISFKISLGAFFKRYANYCLKWLESIAVVDNCISSQVPVRRTAVLSQGTRKVYAVTGLTL